MTDELVEKIATNNSGNMSKQEALEFFNRVVSDLELLDFTMEFTPCSPSICQDNKILFCEKHLNAYPWQIKEEILHELAHHYSRGVTGHSERFYEAYIRLLNKYVCYNELGYRHLSDPSIVKIEPDAELPPNPYITSLAGELTLIYASAQQDMLKAGWVKKKDGD